MSELNHQITDKDRGIGIAFKTFVSKGLSITKTPSKKASKRQKAKLVKELSKVYATKVIREGGLTAANIFTHGAARSTIKFLKPRGVDIEKKADEIIRVGVDYFYAFNRFIDGLTTGIEEQTRTEISNDIIKKIKNNLIQSFDASSIHQYMNGVNAGALAAFREILEGFIAMATLPTDLKKFGRLLMNDEQFIYDAGKEAGKSIVSNYIKKFTSDNHNIFYEIGYLLGKVVVSIILSILLPSIPQLVKLFPAIVKKIKRNRAAKKLQKSIIKTKDLRREFNKIKIHLSEIVESSLEGVIPKKDKRGIADITAGASRVKAKKDAPAKRRTSQKATDTRDISKNVPPHATNKRFKIRKVDYTNYPEHVPPNVVLVFPNGGKIWRTNGIIWTENIVSKNPGRKRLEKDTPTNSGEQAGHPAGAGTGFESPYRIVRELTEINQRVQNHGIEGFLRRLRNKLFKSTSNLRVIMTTANKVRKRSIVLDEITYQIDIFDNGVRRKWFEFTVKQVPGKKGKRDSILIKDLTVRNREFIGLEDLVETMVEIFRSEVMGGIEIKFELI